jgi:hypothetical protein
MSGRGVAPAIAIAKQPAAATASRCGAHAVGGTLTATVAGYHRTAIVHLPSDYTGSTKLALVLNSSRSSPAWMRPPTRTTSSSPTRKA